MMKPVNSKERAKLLWQFVFIFFALCVAPIAIIFYTYYVTPGEISDADMQKVATYSNWEHSQKILAKRLAEIDSNISSLNSGANIDPQMTGANISNELTNLANDSGSLVKTIAKGYTHYFENAKNLSTTKSAANKAATDAQKAQDALTKMNDQKAQADAIANGIKSMGH